MTKDLLVDEIIYSKDDFMVYNSLCSFFSSKEIEEKIGKKLYIKKAKEFLLQQEMWVLEKLYMEEIYLGVGEFDTIALQIIDKGYYDE